MIKEGPLPGTALLQKYARSGAYTDCFYTDILDNVSLPQFVEAFYSTWLFKLERAILRFAVNKPSTDKEAKQVAQGEAETFAAWHVEDRSQHQLLMCDYRGQTRSWFMVTPGRLYFGSAVIPTDRKSYKALLGFHRLYSRMLLAAASSRLQ
ncbi:MAG: hypothetical protein ACR2QL_04250 [Woeseiaceae bacterium]